VSIAFGRNPSGGGTRRQLLMDFSYPHGSPRVTVSVLPGSRLRTR